MNKKQISKTLTAGLLAGYGGKTHFSIIDRGSFKLKSSHFESEDIIYHDEWTNGGGQEIIKVDNDMFTRVYAGGVVGEETLQKLGITAKDIITNLISRIKQLGDKTRLFNNCQPEVQDGWGYFYQILDDNREIGLTVGKEIISYQNQIVFVHVFVLSPIKST
jgi:hypothetical protein